MDMVCKNCKKHFSAKRSSAYYCGTSCRVAWHRKGKEQKAHFLDAQYAIRSIVHMMKEYDHLTLSGDDLLQNLSNLIHESRYGELNKKVADIQNGRLNGF